MASTILGALLRRDANRARRAGTGRQTTKRTFTLTLPGAQSAAQTSAAAHTAAALAAAAQRGVKRDSKGLDDVNSFWRDSLESGAGSEDQQPAEDAAGNPTPFRRQNKLARTPAAGTGGPAVMEGEGEAPPPVRMRSFEDEEDAMLGAASFGQAEEEPPTAAVEAGTDAEPLDRHSMGTSPLAAGDAAGPVERCSMGTSPIVPSLLDAAAGSSEDPSDEQVSGGDFDDDQDQDLGGGDFDDQDDPMVPPDHDSDSDHDAGALVEADAPPPPPLEPHAPKEPKARKAGKQRKISCGPMPTQPADEQTEPALLPANGGRSRRQRFRPLEFWRGEHVVYGRRDSAKFEAVVDVVVVDREPTPPHFRKRRERAAKGGSSALVPRDEDQPDAPVDPLANAVDALQEDAQVEAPAGGRRVKKMAKKAKA